MGHGLGCGDKGPLSTRLPPCPGPSSPPSSSCRAPGSSPDIPATDPRGPRRRCATAQSRTSRLGPAAPSARARFGWARLPAHLCPQRKTSKRALPPKGSLVTYRHCKRGEKQTVANQADSGSPRGATCQTTEAQTLPGLNSGDASAARSSAWAAALPSSARGGPESTSRTPSRFSVPPSLSPPRRHDLPGRACVAPGLSIPSIQLSVCLATPLSTSHPPTESPSSSRVCSCISLPCHLLNTSQLHRAYPSENPVPRLRVHEDTLPRITPPGGSYRDRHAP